MRLVPFFLHPDPFAQVVIQRLFRQGIPAAYWPGPPGWSAPSRLRDILSTQQREPLACWLGGNKACSERDFKRVLPYLSAGDCIVDSSQIGCFTALKRAKACEYRQIGYSDVSILGMSWGAEYGFALFVGGTLNSLHPLSFLLDALAPLPHYGWLHAGHVGSGMFFRSILEGTGAGLLQLLPDLIFTHLQACSGASFDEQLKKALLSQTGTLQRALGELAKRFLEQSHQCTAFHSPFNLDSLAPFSPLATLPHESPAVYLARLVAFMCSFLPDCPSLL